MSKSHPLLLSKKVLLVSVLALLIVPTIAYAIDIPGWPIVPCGLSKDNPSTPDINEAKPCGRCDLFRLLNNVINFIIGGLMPPVAVLLFVAAGFLILLGGANTNLVAQGRQIFTTTFYGIIIMLAAWMITNTLILSIGAKYNNAANWWQFTCTESAPVNPKYSCSQNNQCVANPNGQYTTSNCDNKCQTSGIVSITTNSLPDAIQNQSYSQTLSATGGKTSYSWSVLSGSLPTGLSVNSSSGVISGSPTAVGTSTFTVKVTDNSTPQQSATKQLSIVVTTDGTLACIFNGVNYSTFNLCSGQKRPGGCGTSVCSQYLPSIQRYAGGAATVAVLKTFMVIESDCKIRAGTGTSYGLMQISPNTAKPVAYKCGVAVGDITPSWLTDPANADKSICLGAEIIRSIAAGTCGSEPRNIYAGYNAGPGYCTASNDCAGEQSCGGGAKKKWECPYDNPQKTVCNTRMYQTKQGATYINYCLNNLGF